MKNTPLFALLGGVIGIPVSYWFQPELLRQKMSLGKYLASLPDLLEQKRGSMSMISSSDVFANIVISCVLCALVLGVVGYVLDQQKNQTKG